MALAAKPRVFLIDRPGAEQSQIVAATVGADARRSGSHPLRRARHHARRQFHLAPQHESARGQALVVRRAHARSPMPSGRARSAPAPACRPTRPPSPWSKSARSCATILRLARPDGRRAQVRAGQHRDRAAGQQRDLRRDRRLLWRDPHLRAQGQLLERLRRRSDGAHAGGRQQVRGPARFIRRRSPGWWSAICRRSRSRCVR